MKTKFNILLVITLFTITLFSSFAYANENTKHISIKEYERILKAEYAKYGVEMKVLDYDENKNITRDVLNDVLLTSISVHELLTTFAETCSPLLPCKV